MADDNDPIVQNIDVNVNDENFTDSFDKLKSAAQEAFEALKSIFEKGDFGTGFDKLKESGEKAFESIKESGAKTFEAVKGAGSGAASELSAVFSSLGISLSTALLGVAAVVASIATGLGIATKAALSFVEAQSKVINALGDLSDKTSTAIKDVSALETVFAHAGTSAGEFAAGYSKISDVVEKTWDKIKKDTQSGADSLEQRVIAAKRASDQLNKLKDADDKFKLLQPEENPQPFIGQFTGQRNVPVVPDLSKQIEQELALKQAKLAAREADRAENEARRNDLDNITKGVQSLIDGNNGALKSFNASADNIIKGVVAAAGQGSETLNKLGESFASVGSKAPEIKEVLQQLGLALKNIEDPALRTKVAFAALGPAASGFLDAVDAGKLDQFTSGLDKVNNALSETDKKIASEFRAALTGLSQDLENIKNKLSTAFTGGFTDAIKELDEFFVRISPHIRATADALSGALSPVLKTATVGFVALGEAINTAIDIFKGIQDVIKSVIKLDFSELKSSLLGLVDVAKGIFDIFKGIATLDFKQVKKGLQELADARKKDLEDKEKTDNDKIKSEKEKGKSNLPADVEDILRSADAQDAAKKRGIERALKEADERDRARGIAPPSDKVPAPQGLGDKAADLASRFGESAKQLLDPSALKPLGEAIGESLKKILQDGSLKGDIGGVDAKAETESKGGLLDTIKETFDSLLNKVHEFGPQEKKITDPSGIGIRGDAGDVLEELKTAAAAAAEALNKLAVNAKDDTGSGSDTEVSAADGGHIRGPGTSTSDSIPAMLSDGEFVVKKSAVDRIGLDTLHAINEERLHFAEGGDVERKKKQDEQEARKRQEENKKAAEEQRKRIEELQQAQTEQNQRSAAMFPGLVSSGDGKVADLSGGEGPITVKYPGKKPPWIDSYNEATLAEAERDPNFIPIIYKAMGGLIGGGKVRIGPKLPHFADGSSVSLAPRLPRFADGGAVYGGDLGGGGMQHLGTVDLTTNHGPVRVAVDGGGLSQLRRAAVMRNVGSSPKSSWVK